MTFSVLQWATGAVGREALRGILDHPDLELVGVKVYSADKDGVDAGVNVVTTSFAFHPARTDPADRDRLRTACETGNSSLHGTGLNPGNLGAVVPLALAGMCREISRVTVQERADWSMYDRSTSPSAKCISVQTPPM